MKGNRLIFRTMDWFVYRWSDAVRYARTIGIFVSKGAGVSDREIRSTVIAEARQAPELSRGKEQILYCREKLLRETD